ncbi:MAG: hypothetical protein JXA42_10625, partial [Anaerolineales bacterium]|nr:hypothetical protein [Anaerolineales bacterium]
MLFNLEFLNRLKKGPSQSVRIKHCLFLLVAIILLSACGKQSEPAQVSFMVFGEPAEYQAYQKLVAAFEKEHPEIDIEL